MSKKQDGYPKEECNAREQQDGQAQQRTDQEDIKQYKQGGLTG